MTRYRLSGTVLESSMPLPELPHASGRASFSFTVARHRGAAPRPRWYHRWEAPDGRTVLSFGRMKSRYVLRFPRLIDFELSSDGRRIRACSARVLPPETLRHLLLDQVWPLALRASGAFVLHASAVVGRDGCAIALAGPAGAGKSTLAAALAATGSRVLADDCLLLKPVRQGWSAVPSYPGLRLWPDMIEPLDARRHTLSDVAHYTGKQRLAGTGFAFASAAAPLAAVYLVSPRDGRARTAVTRLSPAQAVMALVPSTYLLDHEDREELQRSFAHLTALASSVPAFHLDLPHAVERLHEVVAILSRRS